MSKDSNVAAARKTLEKFVQKDPNAHYSFDSERDAPESEICRHMNSAKGRKDCMTLKLHATAMFASMQDLGFYCALPMDPRRTYIECKPLPKELR